MMHVAARFQSSDAAAPLQFINTLRFGTLVTIHAAQELHATPVPWVAEPQAYGMVLWGHLAKANPQVAAIGTQAQAVVTFTGPHAYISPRILPTPRSAPTWNYIAVHVHGQCELLDAAGTEFAVEKLVQAAESDAERPWTTAELGERREQLLRHVVGMRVTGVRVEAKFKLGQNESAVDYAAILAHFKALGDRDMVQAMRYANASRAGEPST